ncbi:MAG: uroporphyrinogen-III C-methyltransferase [Coriobacteriales bacterium]|jgi:uroporphyrinogen III methyltransferase/synthase|nr:uroporphyrinogen-III C-methyltransferase [Coriobacteriales bacterium]
MSEARPQRGFVYLVGAGPGDPGLLTVRGRECIERADTLVYDRLVASSLLALAPPGSELVNAGKLPGKHPLPQHEINTLLVARAQAGRVVVRLKGGDPFVFGRGGEEAEALRAAGIRYAVVPGVSSAVAAAAYAGIPISHRELASVFTVVTGHEDPAKEEPAIAWEHLAQTRGTLVFLMGMERLDGIVERLVAEGMDASTPVAVIEQGTCPSQRTAVSDLTGIVAAVEQAGLGNPAVIVVGQVVNLRKRLAWFEERPLSGLRVVVTRARAQASRFSHLLRGHGAEVLEFPLIHTLPPADPMPLRAALHELEGYQWLAFTSANGVEAFFAELDLAGDDVRRLAGLKLATIGPATSAALAQRGLKCDLEARECCNEGLAEVLVGAARRGERLLLLRAEETRAGLTEALRGHGLTVDDVAAYRTAASEEGTDGLLEAFRQGTVDAVTFTSSSTVKRFVSVLGTERRLLKGVALFSIGPVTSATMRDYGIEPTGQAARYTVEGLVEALIAQATSIQRGREPYGFGQTPA